MRRLRLFGTAALGEQEVASAVRQRLATARRGGHAVVVVSIVGQSERVIGKYAPICELGNLLALRDRRPRSHTE